MGLRRMKEFTVEEVEEVLSEDEGLTMTEIGEEVLRNRGYEDPSLWEKQVAKDKASYAMVDLMDAGKITSTPDWKYRLARRADDGS